MALVYHLLKPQDWELALQKGVYAPASLHTEGFIHCSTQAQVPLSAARFFEGEETLVVLGISEKVLGKTLRWEPAASGELFPHVYGKLPIEWVADTYMLLRNKDGAWEWV
ncbi:MAG: DUF952 domain-containing protein [Bacteroidia bacterium]